MKTLNKKIIVLAVILLFSLSIFVGLYKINTINALSGWNSNMKITIGQSLGANINYDVQIIVYNLIGTNSGNTLYIGSGSTSDNFGDIRFTDSTGINLLNYWQQIVMPTYSVFWVQISGNLSISSQVIYMYYGKTEQTTISTISIFPIYDDFSSSISGSWSWTNQPTYPASYSVANSNLTINSGGQATDIWGTSNTGYQLLQAIPTVATAGFQIITKFTCSPVVPYDSVGIIIKATVANTWIYSAYQFDGTLSTTAVDLIADTSGTNTGMTALPVSPQQCYLALNCLGSSYSMQYSNNPVFWTSWGTVTGSSSCTTLGIFLKTGGSTVPFSGAFDWVIVRPLTSVEPSVNSGTYQFSQNPPINSNDKDEKVAMIGSQRYVLTNTWTTSSPYGTAIKVYAVNSNWMPLYLVATSSFIAADFYVETLLSFPNSIIIVGRADSTNTNGGFVAAYNTNNNTWTYAIQPNIQYITDICNPVTNQIFIQVALASPIAFYKTTATNLFTPASWTAINDPSWAIETSQKEFRIAYFNGVIYAGQLSVIISSTDFKWVFGSYNLTTSAWSASPLMSCTDATTGNAYQYLFGYVYADSNILTFTAPFSNSTWSIYYSINGLTFNLVKNVASAIPFSTNFITEQHCQAVDFNNAGNSLIISNELDNNLNGYMAIMDLSGNVLAQGSYFTCHCTEINLIFDNNLVVQGGEVAQPQGSAIIYYANVKLITINSIVITPIPTPTSTPISTIYTYSGKDNNNNSPQLPPTYVIYLVFIIFIIVIIGILYFKLKG